MELLTVFDFKNLFSELFEPVLTRRRLPELYRYDLFFLLKKNVLKVPTHLSFADSFVCVSGRTFLTLLFMIMNFLTRSQHVMRVYLVLVD
jgi:hypothetical protein